jgi:hypothetical protein
MEGAYLKRYVTDEQRSRRPIFIATLWAGVSWLFFRLARSTRMTQIWRFSASSARTALKNSQLTSGKLPRISGTGHYCVVSSVGSTRCALEWRCPW